MIALGAPLAEKNVLVPLDYFIRSGEVSESAQIVVAQPTATDLLRPPAPEGVALPLFQYLRRAQIIEVATAPDPMWRFLAQLHSPTQAAYAPLVEASSQGEPFKAEGTALFSRGRMVDTLTGYQASVLDWLIKREGFPTARVLLPGAKKMSTLHVVHVRKRLQVLSAQHAVIHLHFEVYLSEAPGLAVDDRPGGPFEQAAASQLTKQLRGVLDVLQRNGADVIGLAPYVHARYPGATADWPSAFSRLQLGLDVSVSLTGGGRKD